MCVLGPSHLLGALWVQLSLTGTFGGASPNCSSDTVATLTAALCDFPWPVPAQLFLPSHLCSRKAELWLRPACEDAGDCSLSVNTTPRSRPRETRLTVWRSRVPREQWGEGWGLEREGLCDYPATKRRLRRVSREGTMSVCCPGAGGGEAAGTLSGKAQDL